MNLNNLSYATTVVVFTGLALALYLILSLVFPPSKSKLNRHDWQVILRAVVLTVFLTGPMEWLALTWKAWAYSAQRTLHTTFLGAEIENYLFTGLVTLVIGIATILYARREDRHRP